jgi:3',5'-cyclic AMP phosphodiesterase CpdA
MKTNRLILAIVLLLFILASLGLFIRDLIWKEAPGAFKVEPYIQLGNRPSLSGPEALTLVWQADDREARWSVMLKPSPASHWQAAGEPSVRALRFGSFPPARLYSADLTNIPPGQSFAYRVLKDGNIVFAARARARKNATQPYSFAVFGDLGTGSAGQRKIAFQVHRAQPDFVVMPGDIVYKHGRLSEYLERFFPIYNAEEASPSSGAPLLRSVLFVAAPGNHDIGTTNYDKARDLFKFPDGMAYFFLWNQPLNGPLQKPDAANIPQLIGSPALTAPFLSAAGANYPSMANFSFDYGNSHWTILDGNDYMDWTDPALRAWLENDLKASGKAVWRFVAFHQSPFSSGKTHFTEQRMRLLADIFQKWRVDIVFTGHQHNYQRTFPLRFRALPWPDGGLLSQSGEVDGVMQLDRLFDGHTRTRPNGVIYVVTGAGGAPLVGRKTQDQKFMWQPYTDKFVADTHSFTLCEVTGRRLAVRQISEDGRELDRFTMSK